MNDNRTLDPGFSPADITDDRPVGDWASRYTDLVAQRMIRTEAIVLAAHLGLAIAAILGLAIFGGGSAGATGTQAASAAAAGFGWEQVVFSWLGGILAGTVYAIKWLYHVVGKGLWNIDRRLWRLFTPHVSGAIALAFIALLHSGLLMIVDRKALNSVWMCFAISFLVGYFSDSATAKMSEVAQTLFGTTASKKRARAKKARVSDEKPRQTP